MHLLTPYDDLLWHQVAAPFGEAATSDPHFNDGYYFAVYDPDGTAFIFAGIRVHVNSNVMDGYGGAVFGTRQAGVRVSRELRPKLESRVGPLTIQVLEPMCRFRVSLGKNSSGVVFDLEWKASAPAFLEARHFTRRYGRVTNDLLRYTQSGRASGTLSLPFGRAFEFDGWFGCRDHSWGLRQTMGPDERPRGTHGESSDPRALRLWVPFEVGDHAGFFHFHEDHEGRRLDCEGALYPFDGSAAIALKDVEHYIEYGGNGRLVKAWFRLTETGGRAREYVATPILPPAHPMGFGYSHGWSDGGNPGIWRGVEVEEAYNWEVGQSSPPQALPLGGTEFVCRLEHEASTGMAHVEHMRYDRRRFG